MAEVPWPLLRNNSLHEALYNDKIKTNLLKRMSKRE